MDATSENKLKIANILWLFPKLSETSLTLPLVELEKRGHSLWVHALKDPRRVPPLEDLTTEHVIHRHLRDSTLLHRVAYFRDADDLYSQIAGPAREEPDVFMFHWGDFIPYLLSWPPLDRPVILSCHEPDFSNAFLPTFIREREEVLRRVAAVFVECRYQIHDLVAAGFPEDRLTYWREGLDLAAIDAAVEVAKRDRRTKPFRMVSVGRFVPKKGFDRAIEAMRLLVDAGHDVEYLIVGDGVLMPYIAGLIEDLQLSERVQLTGKIPHPDLYEVVASADAFIVPSQSTADGDREGLLSTLLEAMACGIPVIGTSHGGTPDVLHNGVTGMLIDDNEPRTIAEAVEQVMGDVTGSARMGHAARDFVRSNHDLQNATDLIERVVRRVAAD